MTQSKRFKAINEKLDSSKIYGVTEAFTAVIDVATVKFIESVDVSINLGVDTRKSDQSVRGSVVLPKGTGKTVKVAVFTDGQNADAAKAAGADIVGMEDLAEIVKKGELDADVVIASPDAMKVIGRLGQILGPRGLMPNPKDGTVSADVATAVKSAKAGQVRFRADKNGIIHASIGKVNFKAADLAENLNALLDTVKKLKPISMKGVYLRKLTISTTMGPGLQVDLSSI
jgi:large subunit ribosomal protein L1